MNFKLGLLLLAISSLVFFFLGSFCADRLDLTAGRNKLTNPLLKHVKFRELRPFRNKIEALIKEKKKQGLVSEAAVYFRSLADGIWIGIDEKKKFCPASLLKIPVMLSYFKLAENDPDILNKKIRYELQGAGEFVPGVKQERSAGIGKDYSAGELIELMIAESDNNAYLLLARNLPAGALERTYAVFGVDLDTILAGADFASLKLCASFFRVLYNASYLNEALSEKALRCLARSKYRQGLVEGVPGNVAVAHKFGERFFEKTGEKQLHEVAIVYHPQNPYILAIMTRGRNYSCLDEVIKEISALTYQEVDAQYRTPQIDFTVSE